MFTMGVPYYKFVWSAYYRYSPQEGSAGKIYIYKDTSNTAVKSLNGNGWWPPPKRTKKVNWFPDPKKVGLRI